METNLLTEAEKKVVHILADAWNAFLQLPAATNSHDISEFMLATHAAQRVVLAWAGRRQMEREE